MKKFITNLMAIVTALGFKAKLDEGKLSAEEQKAIVAEYNKTHGDGAWAADLQAYQEERNADAEAQALAATFRELAQAAGVPEAEAHTPEGQAALLAAVNAMKSDLAKLASQAQPDNPVAVVTTRVSVTGAHTEAFAFGINNPLYSTGKRYNRILVTGRIEGKPTAADKEALQADFTKYAEGLAERMTEFHKLGLIPAIREGKVNMDALTSDTEIGTRQFNIRRDMLLARIIALPTLAGIFDTVSNVQSGEVITNVLFSEISQAYQAGEVFKGGADFQPEKAIVHDAMAKILFEDMKQLEYSYLNYLNREGSDPVKWTLIEWLVLQMAIQINNERLRRAIIGYRIDPVKGTAGHVNFASTGVLWRLISLYEGLRFLPFKDADLADYSAADFGDVIIAFMEKIKIAHPEIADKLVVYLNKSHKPMYKAWYRSEYGRDTDFTGVEFKVPNHENPIVWVPDMGNLKFMIATVPGNIELLQNVPGEEFDFKFERHLEEVQVYSYWKEGAGVAFCGKAFNTLAALLANAAEGQYLFMNWPAIALAADATTASVKGLDSSDLGFLITTGANTDTTALTDIVGAKAGVVYRIECGSTTNATTIAKSGKFSELTAAWEPDAVGKFLKVYYNPTDEKFIEVARG